MTVKRAANHPGSEAPQDRPWQIMLTGHGLEQIDAGTRTLEADIAEMQVNAAALAKAGASKLLTVVGASASLPARIRPGPLASGMGSGMTPRRDRRW
jgi:hypothetical protein